MGQYGVTVYERHFKELFEAGDITLLDSESAVLNNFDLYDKKVGLSLEADWGKAIMW